MNSFFFYTSVCMLALNLITGTTTFQTAKLQSRFIREADDGGDDQIDQCVEESAPPDVEEIPDSKTAESFRIRVAARNPPEPEAATTVSPPTTGTRKILGPEVGLLRSVTHHLHEIAEKEHAAAKEREAEKTKPKESKKKDLIVRTPNPVKKASFKPTVFIKTKNLEPITKPKMVKKPLRINIRRSRDRIGTGSNIYSIKQREVPDSLASSSLLGKPLLSKRKSNVIQKGPIFESIGPPGLIVRPPPGFTKYYNPNRKSKLASPKLNEVTALEDIQDSMVAATHHDEKIVKLLRNPIETSLKKDARKKLFIDDQIVNNSKLGLEPQLREANPGGEKKNSNKTDCRNTDSDAERLGAASMHDVREMIHDGYELEESELARNNVEALNQVLENTSTSTISDVTPLLRDMNMPVLREDSCVDSQDIHSPNNGEKVDKVSETYPIDNIVLESIHSNRKIPDNKTGSIIKKPNSLAAIKTEIDTKKNQARESEPHIALNEDIESLDKPCVVPHIKTVETRVNDNIPLESINNESNLPNVNTNVRDAISKTTKHDDWLGESSIIKKLVSLIDMRKVINSKKNSSKPKLQAKESKPYSLVSSNLKLNSEHNTCEIQSTTEVSSNLSSDSKSDRTNMTNNNNTITDSRKSNSLVETTQLPLADMRKRIKAKIIDLRPKLQATESEAISTPKENHKPQEAKAEPVEMIPSESINDEINLPNPNSDGKHLISKTTEEYSEFDKNPIFEKPVFLPGINNIRKRPYLNSKLKATGSKPKSSLREKIKQESQYTSCEISQTSTTESTKKPHSLANIRKLIQLKSLINRPELIENKPDSLLTYDPNSKHRDIPTYISRVGSTISRKNAYSDNIPLKSIGVKSILPYDNNVHTDTRNTLSETTNDNGMLLKSLITEKPYSLDAIRNIKSKNHLSSTAHRLDSATENNNRVKSQEILSEMPPVEATKRLSNKVLDSKKYEISSSAKLKNVRSGQPKLENTYGYAKRNKSAYVSLNQVPGKQQLSAPKNAVMTDSDTADTNMVSRSPNEIPLIGTAKDTIKLKLPCIETIREFIQSKKLRTTLQTSNPTSNTNNDKAINKKTYSYNIIGDDNIPQASILEPRNSMILKRVDEDISRSKIVTSVTENGVRGLITNMPESELSRDLKNIMKNSSFKELIKMKAASSKPKKLGVVGTESSHLTKCIDSNQEDSKNSVLTVLDNPKGDKLLNRTKLNITNSSVRNAGKPDSVLQPKYFEAKSKEVYESKNVKTNNTISDGAAKPKIQNIVEVIPRNVLIKDLIKAKILRLAPKLLDKSARTFSIKDGSDYKDNDSDVAATVISDLIGEENAILEPEELLDTKSKPATLKAQYEENCDIAIKSPEKLRDSSKIAKSVPLVLSTDPIVVDNITEAAEDPKVQKIINVVPHKAVIKDLIKAKILRLAPKLLDKSTSTLPIKYGSEYKYNDNAVAATNKSTFKDEENAILEPEKLLKTRKSEIPKLLEANNCDIANGSRNKLRDSSKITNFDSVPLGTDPVATVAPNFKAALATVKSKLPLLKGNALCTPNLLLEKQEQLKYLDDKSTLQNPESRTILREDESIRCSEGDNILGADLITDCSNPDPKFKKAKSSMNKTKYVTGDAKKPPETIIDFLKSKNKSQDRFKLGKEADRSKIRLSSVSEPKSNDSKNNGASFLRESYPSTQEEMCISPEPAALGSQLNENDLARMKSGKFILECRLTPKNCNDFR